LSFRGTSCRMYDISLKSTFDNCFGRPSWLAGPREPRRGE
jgi:hypothetical protein